MHATDKAQRIEAFVAAVRVLAADLGRTPTQLEYKLFATSRMDIPSQNQVRYLFGTWTTAVLSAGLQPAPNDPPSSEIDETELVSEFLRVANDLGRMPSMEVFRQRSRFSNRPYVKRWGGKWSEVVRHFATTFSNDLIFDVTIAAREEEVILERRPLGLDLPMAFVPENEYETVVLFALLASSLGCKIVRIGSAFPDAEIEIAGELRQVEFEYVSSNYIRHGHERSSRFTCICWRIDAEIAPVQVLSLENEVIRRRGVQMPTTDHSVAMH